MGFFMSAKNIHLLLMAVVEKMLYYKK